ncbi:MAG TPA: hypothetical protein PLP19_08765 [bacterium]|nr:hypothetical protein [bacterium]HPN43565.1 hypothetical protein [bacterium]
MNPCSRRRFLTNCLSAIPVLAMGCATGNKISIPIRALTGKPGYHWFGLPDRLAFDLADRYVLGHALETKNSLPHPDDVIRIGMIDIKSNDRWYELGNTQTWNLNQDCMLQWLPGSATRLIWNNRQGSFFGSVLLDIKSGQKQFLPYPVYSLHADGKTALSLDFERLYDLCPGYGYAGLNDVNQAVPAPGNAGVYKIDLETGDRQTLVSLAQLAELPQANVDWTGAWHFVNRLQYSPDGEHCYFIHGWQKRRADNNAPDGDAGARIVTVATDGSALRAFDLVDVDSFCNWYDSQHLLYRAAASGKQTPLLLVNIETGERQEIAAGIIPGNGYCARVPGTEWLFGDAAGESPEIRRLYLYNNMSGQVKDVATFTQPAVNNAEWRVQLNPRISHDGKKLVIDSAHEINGPQMYLIDVGKITR